MNFMLIHLLAIIISRILNYLFLATCLYLKYIKPSNINQIGVKKIAFLVVSFTNSKQNTKKKNTNIA